MSRLLSSFTPRLQKVDAPSTPLRQLTPNDSSAISFHTNKYPFNTATPTGVFEVSNAIVDKQQKVGAWSEPKVLDLKSGWRLYALGDNQPPSADDVGIVWKLKCVSLAEPDPKYAYAPGGEYLLTTAFQCDLESNLGIVPYSSVRPVYDFIREPETRRMALDKLAYGGRHTFVAPPPKVAPSQFPVVAMKLAYSRITHEGETNLSPAFDFVPPTPPAGWTAAEAGEVRFGLQEPHPQGTHGYYVYAQLEESGPWLRMPHADGDIWQLDNMQPTLMFPPTAIEHVPDSDSHSQLSKMNVALADYGGDIIIDEEVELTSPLIDEWRSGAGETFYRRISKDNGGRWVPTFSTGPYAFPPFAPELLVYNSYSHWVGLKLDRPASPRNVVFSDWSGGQGFGVEFTNCEFQQGLRVAEDSTATVGGHTASEVWFTNCKFAGKVPLWLAGQQTANIRFNRCFAQNFGTSNRSMPAIYISTPNTVSFKGGLFTDCPGNVIFNVTVVNLYIEDIWVDQGFKSLIDIASWGSANIKIVGGKLNAWSAVGERPNLARSFNPVEASDLVFNSVVLQFNNTLTLDVVNPLFNRMGLRFEDTLLARDTILREPTQLQTQTNGYLIYGYPPSAWPDVQMPGYNIIVPSISSSPGILSSSTVSIIIPSQTIVANSLTGQPVVSRESWTS